jgi:hypothetical protein
LCVEWLNDITFEHDNMQVVGDAARFMELTQANAPVQLVYGTWLLMLHFLELKQSTREHQMDRIIDLCPALYWICSASGHPKVAEQCLRLLFDGLALLPAVREAQINHMIAALSNKPAVGEQPTHQLAIGHACHAEITSNVITMSCMLQVSVATL